MKTSIISRLFIISCLLLFQFRAIGQVNISVQILPPYPTKFTDYASRPHQMIVSLTNTSTTIQRVQLRGSVSGDNGVSIRSKPDYRSSSPIELSAGQTRNLNGSDIAFFFDYTDLQYTGITQNEFINRGGLPEGRYQLCLRAFGYDNDEPLSPEEPSGCSNFFSISSLEPPVILSPMAEQVIPSGPGQIFSIRWNTPVSTPPGIQYRIRMVEILGNRNPNDAIMTATQPYFFEKEVMTNMYVYNPADPQLTPGRNYALMIEAFDPFNNAVFRNNGRSEVIMFTYGEAVPTGEGLTQDTLPRSPVVILGTLKYRFPESPESGTFSVKNTKVHLEKVIGPQNTEIVAGTETKTDAEGNFEINADMVIRDSSRLATYRLKVSNPHYKDAGEYLNVILRDTVDMQERTLEANSYQLNVNVAESFNGINGKYVAGAKVRIYRLKADKINSHLAIPLEEGNLLDSGAHWKEFGNKVLIAEATTPGPDPQAAASINDPAAYTASFKRLFRNASADDGYYLISLEKGAQVLRQMSFDALTETKTRIKNKMPASWPQTENEQSQDVWEDFSYNQQPDTTLLTLNKEVTASPRSKVTGILKYRFKYYSGIPDQPYANMRVTLRSSEDMQKVVAAAVTDGNGRFVFDFDNVDSTYKAKVVRQGGRTVGFDRRVYHVVPEVKYYAIPNDEVLVQPWGDYDCGELVSLVQTYSLKLDIKDLSDEPLPQAEVLVLRYQPETYEGQLPNLAEMNSAQRVVFSGSNASTNNYTPVNGQSSQSGGFILQKTLYTPADGGQVIIKGLIPSLDLNTDRYQVRIGSADRSSNSVAYETTIMHYPYAVLSGPPEIDVIVKDKFTIPGKIQAGKDELYDPTWGYRNMVTLDPGGSVMKTGANIDILKNNNMGVVGNTLKVNQIKQMGGGRIGYTFHQASPLFESREWQALSRFMKQSHVTQPAPKQAALKQPPTFGFFTIGPVIEDDAIIFNSQLSATEPLEDDIVRINKKAWRIAGRGIDSISKLGAKNISAYVCQSDIVYGKIKYYDFGKVTANDNGDFVITPADLYLNSTGFRADKNAILRIVAPGYQEKIIDIGQITEGKQFYDEQIILEPLGVGMYGYVVDANEPRYSIPARIKMIDNGMWVNTVPYSGDKHKEAMNSGQSLDLSEQIRDAQRFSIDLPATKVKLVVMPYSRAYLTDTIEVDMDQGDLFIGMIKLTPRVHKMRVDLEMNSNEPMVPALVTLVETGMQYTIMNPSAKGIERTAYFQFVNNATKNYTLHVKPLSNTPVAGKRMFVPHTYTVSSVDDGKEHPVIHLEVFPGRPVKGKVSFNTGEVAKNAKVYMEAGYGGPTDNFVYSNENGEYNMVLPQLGISVYTIRANYSEEGKTYVSAEKKVGPDDQLADLVITRVDGIDMSRLLGFKTNISALTKAADDTYEISGELSDLPANTSFSFSDSILNRSLTFTNIRVRASEIKNKDGVPLAVPVENTIITDNTELAVKINKAFNGMMHGSTDRIMINKAGADTSGTVTGRVRILDNSFQFPSSYMRMLSTDFYLGRDKGAETMSVFSSAGSGTAASRFLLTNKQGSAISFKYLGFNGVAETQGDRTSVINGETIHLYMNLSTTLPGGVPITLKAGEARIQKGSVGRIITSDTLSFKLEKWTVKASRPALAMIMYNMETGESETADNSTWMLSPNSGGLVIKRGEIITGKMNVPFKNMTIIPNEEGFPGDLTCPDLMDQSTLQNANFTVGGIAKLKMTPGAKAMFIYDPGVGRDGAGHYKLSVTSSAYNSYAASFAGLDGMTNPRESFKIQIISMLSNGEELFSFVNNQKITYYNQIRFSPKTLSVTDQNSFSVAGSIDLGIPYLNTSFYQPLVYSKNGSKNKLTMPVLDFSFLGKGNVKFMSVATREAQQFKPEGFVIAGNMSLPGGVNLKGGKLIAMVTSGAQDLIDASGAGGLSGGVTNPITREVDVLFGAKEQIETYLQDTKQQLDAKIQEAKDELLAAAEDAVKDEVTKLVPMGTDAAKGALGDLAGAWKLGTGAADAMADGDYMRLAGMMKNLPGIDEAVQEVKNAMVLTASNSLNAVQEHLPTFKDVPVSGDGFEAGEFEFDLKNGRIFGSISFDFIGVGAVNLRNGGMEILFDRNGWYFCTGATMEFPMPMFSPLKVGVLIGNYGQISDELEARVTQMAQSVSHKLPPAVKSGLSGFFIVGGKPIADVDIGFGIPGIAQFKLVASAGAEVRTYAMFGKGTFTMGMGALAYGRVFASASALGVSVSGGADLDVAIATTAKSSNGEFGLCIQGCISAKIFVEACVLGGCGSLSEEIMATLNLGIGSNTVLGTTGCGKNGIGLGLALGKGTCLNNPDFDF